MRNTLNVNVRKRYEIGIFYFRFGIMGTDWLIYNIRFEGTPAEGEI